MDQRDRNARNLLALAGWLAAIAGAAGFDWRLAAIAGGASACAAMLFGMSRG